ncbi:MAG: SMP-30/gluconolactonase/LRE family protein [Actinomycetia bacterium]|nr:SMP-30/gluconolactonase/LRE family protein [Actinomycetes bacterium]
MLDTFSMLVQGLDHPEGVTWGPDGHLYAGGEAGQIYRAKLDGRVEQIGTTRCFVLGLALDANLRVYACDLYHHKVFLFEPSTGGLEIYSSGTDEAPLNQPNYPAFDDAGNLYVSSSGDWGPDDGKLFRISATGETSIWSTEPDCYTNGCCLGADGDAIYVVESRRPLVSRIPILADGSAGAREIVTELRGCAPDGIALDVDGSLYVSCYSPNHIYRITPDGVVELLVEDPSGTMLSTPTNVVFAGDDLDRLVVANVSRFNLAITQLGVRGLPLRYPAIRRETVPPSPYIHRF